MLEGFPKKRKELPEAFQKIYISHYRDNRDGKTLATAISKKMESWLHKKVAADSKDGKQQSTLEIGAGTLNHLAFESNTPYDIVEPFRALFENSPKLKRVRNVYNDITEVSEDTRYDRIISVAAFEHITDLPLVIAHAALHLKSEGCLRAAFPNEGKFLWKLAHTISTGIEFRLRHGLKYSVLMNYEHVNTADEIEQVLHYFFSDTQCAVFGLSKTLAFYRYYECRQPNITKAKEYLLSRS